MNGARIAGLILAAIILLAATSGYAQSTNDVPGISRVTGDTSVIQPPGSLADGVLENDLKAFIFLEREDQTLTDTLRVNIKGTGSFVTESSLRAGNIASGTTVNSYFFHRDPTGVFFTIPGVGGTVTFQQEILGIIVNSALINSTTSRFATQRTNYDLANGLEFSDRASRPLDEIEISSNGRTLTYFFQNNAEIDQIRIITRSTGDSTTSGGGGSGSGSGGGSGSSSGGSDPNARGDSASTSINSDVVIDVLDNDSDEDNNIDRETLRVTSQPENGSVSVDTGSGEITYTPDSGFSGTDKFVYEVCDTTNRCDPGTVTVTVSGDSDRGSGGSGSSGSGGSSGSSGSGGGSSSQVTLQTLLPPSDNCLFYEQASIDVVPGNDSNIVRLDDSRGFTPVAILSTDLFPAANCVDASSITFGPSGNQIEPVSCGAVSTRSNEFMDVVCDFKTADMNFSIEDTYGALSATTIQGGSISARGIVNVKESRRLRSRIIESENSLQDIKAMQIGQSIFVGSSNSDAATTELIVLSTQGKVVFQESQPGQALRWNMRSAKGHVLANGVYLYLVRQFDAAGNLLRYHFDKLVIVR